MTKRATEDIYDGQYLAFRKGEEVPDGNRLATRENTAGEDTKAAKAAKREAATEADQSLADVAEARIEG